MADASSSWIFVSGAPKSGTTLMQGLLSGSRHTTPLLGEMQYLKHVLNGYAEVGRSWEDDSRYFFDNQQEAREQFLQFLESHFAKVAGRYDARLLVIKAPELTEYVRELQELFPAAPKIALMRDPRDVVALQLEATRREAELGFGASMLGGYDRGRIEASFSTSKGVGAMVRELSDGVRAAYAKLPADGWHLLAYETLVTRPTEFISDLEKLTGWKIEATPEDPWRNNRFSFLTDSRTFQRAWHSPLWGKPVSAARIGAFRHMLGEESLEIVDEACSDVTAMWKSLLSGNTPNVPSAR